MRSAVNRQIKNTYCTDRIASCPVQESAYTSLVGRAAPCLRSPFIHSVRQTLFDVIPAVTRVARSRLRLRGRLGVEVEHAAAMVYAVVCQLAAVDLADAVLHGVHVDVFIVDAFVARRDDALRGGACTVGDGRWRSDHIAFPAVGAAGPGIAPHLIVSFIDSFG
jgi:hypothetical protein